MLQRETLESLLTKYHSLGDFCAGIPLPGRISLEEREINLEGQDKVHFLRLMRKMLQWEPHRRSSTEELLKDEWLAEILWGGTKTLNRPCVVLSETKSVLLKHRPRNFDGPKTWRSEPFIISDEHGSLARDRSRRLVANINKRSETSAASTRIDQRKRPPSSKIPSSWTEKSILDNFFVRMVSTYCSCGRRMNRATASTGTCVQWLHSHLCS